MIRHNYGKMGDQCTCMLGGQYVIVPCTTRIAETLTGHLNKDELATGIEKKALDDTVVRVFDLRCC